MTNTTLPKIMVLAAASVVPDVASADCMEGTGSADWAVRMNHPHICGDLYKEPGLYNMRDKDWRKQGRGWTIDGCDSEQEFLKHALATKLMQDGIAFDGAVPYAIFPEYFYPYRAFHHSVKDYFKSARAEKTKSWHKRLRHNCNDGHSVYATIHAHRPLPWEVEGFCTLYDPLDEFGNPNQVQAAVRASTFIHEAWHGILKTQGWEKSHDKCTICEPDCFEIDCDPFYAHDLGEFDPGEMHELEDASRFHTPFQAEYEFLCDIMVRRERWVPIYALLGAGAELEYMTHYHFTNPASIPGCYVADPLGEPPLVFTASIEPLHKECDTQAACTENSDCNFGEFCIVGCCHRFE